MRHALRIFVALLVVSAVPLVAGVQLVKPHVDEPLDANESAALFVGIREFAADPTLTEVRYAVDDAVDFAYLVAVDAAPHLVEPNRIILSLAGEPQKPASKRKLEALIAAGAVRHPASQTDILMLLEQQARIVGPRGLLIVAFSTHGINYEGTQYLLTATSLLRYRNTAISETAIREIVAIPTVERSLILIDACRQRLASDTREGEPDPRSAAPLLRSLGSVSGHVVLSAAAPGQYAYDDDAQRNGVFTAAVIDGLRCLARKDDRGFVTVETLTAYVEDRVLTWIQKNRDPGAHRAIQLSSEGKASKMPLAQCGVSRPSQRHGRSSPGVAGATEP